MRWKKKIELAIDSKFNIKIFCNTQPAGNICQP